MKILFNKLVIAAFVLSMLIVLGAHFGGRWLYKVDSKFAPTSTVSVPDGAFSGKGASSHNSNVQEYNVPHWKSPDSNESPSASDWHEEGGDMPNSESVSRLTDEERKAAMRQIRIWDEKIKEAKAGLPPLMLSNPEQYLKEWQRHVDGLTMEAEKMQIEAEDLLGGSLDNIDLDALLLPQNLENLYLQAAQLRRKLEEYRSQNPHEEVTAAMIERLKKMEVWRVEDEAFAEKLMEKLNEKGIGF